MAKFVGYEIMAIYGYRNYSLGRRMIGKKERGALTIEILAHIKTICVSARL